MLAHTGQLFELGLRLIPVIVKAGLAIGGIGGRGGSGGPVALNAWPSLMAICPATYVGNGVLTILRSALQTAAYCIGSSNWIAWLVRVVVFVASSLVNCSANEIWSCAVSCLLSCLHSVVLQQVLGVVMLGQRKKNAKRSAVNR